MSKVLIVYTGGTIGMKKGENGYVPDRASFKKNLFEFKILKDSRMPEWEYATTDDLLDSSNMTVDDWNQIGKIISEHYHSYDGFVILHGTDTMAYTASALSFMLENLDKPVIITGAQIPLCEIRSDGYDNLISSVLIAGEQRVREVCIYFGGKLIRGNRATKFSADGLGAFVSPNYPCLAEAGISITYNSLYVPPKISGGFRFVPFKNVPIGVIKVFPGIQFSLFESIMTEKLKGIVIEGFGAGNIPDDEGALLPIIRKAYEHGTILAVCSQCPQGTVALGTYATSASLKEAGAVSGYDITTEAAVSKLYYLFSKGYGIQEIKELMETELRGELTNPFR